MSDNSNPDGAQLEAILRQQLGRRFCEVRVAFRCDGVVLRGRVESWYSKQLAQQLAKEMTGRLVVNELEVASRRTVSEEEQ